MLSVANFADRNACELTRDTAQAILRGHSYGLHRDNVPVATLQLVYFGTKNMAPAISEGLGNTGGL